MSLNFTIFFQLRREGTLCRNANGNCDVEEYCTGESPIVRTIDILFIVNIKTHRTRKKKKRHRSFPKFKLFSIVILLFQKVFDFKSFVEYPIQVLL